MDELLQKISDSTYADDAALYADWLSALENANGNIGGTEQQEMNEALINAIYVKYLNYGTDSLNNAEQETIAQMALQCPFIGGAAVYKARMLNALYQSDILYDDLDICNNQGVYKGSGKGLFDEENDMLAQINATHVKDFKIYPNPSSGLIFVEYDQSGELEVMNLLGQKVVAYKLTNNKASLTLSTKNMPEGIYIYRYIVNGKTENTGKLVLTK